MPVAAWDEMKKKKKKGKKPGVWTRRRVLLVLSGFIPPVFGIIQNRLIGFLTSADFYVGGWVINLIGAAFPVLWFALGVLFVISEEPILDTAAFVHAVGAGVLLIMLFQEFIINQYFGIFGVIPQIFFMPTLFLTGNAALALSGATGIEITLLAECVVGFAAMAGLFVLGGAVRKKIKLL